MWYEKYKERERERKVKKTSPVGHEWISLDGPELGRDMWEKTLQMR